MFDLKSFELLGLTTLRMIEMNSFFLLCCFKAGDALSDSSHP